MLRRMLIGAAVLVVLMAAPAAAQYPFNVSPGTVVAGGDVTVSGQGCAPGAEVTITLTLVTPAKAAGDGVVVATVIADENGKFTVTFTVPEGTAAGTYNVSATCGGVEVASANIEVVDSSPTTTTTRASGGGSTTPIVRTGSDLNGLGLAGAGLITVGGIILLATRSRRHQARS